jgi:hypothetical protein
MKKFIIALIAYFLGGWIIKNIIFALIPLFSDTTTIKDLITYEGLIYSAITFIICTEGDIWGDEELGNFWYLLPISIALFIIVCFPYSIAAIILYNIINIASIYISIRIRED